MSDEGVEQIESDRQAGRRQGSRRPHALFDDHPDAMYEVALDGTIVAGNAALHRLFDAQAAFGVDELDGLDLAALIDEDDRDRLVADLRGLDSPRTYVVSGRFADGRARRLRVTHLPSQDGGAASGVFGVVHDLGTHHDSQAALELGEARYRSLFEWSGAGISMTDLDGRYLDANPAFCQLVGYDVDELRGMSVHRISHPDDHERNDELLRRLLAGEIPSFRLEKRYLTKDGGTVWARMHASLVRDTVGDPLHVVATVEDITASRRAESRLERSRSLLRIAGRKARVGGWAVDAATRQVFWSDEIYDLLDADRTHPPDLDDAIDAYPAGYRELIRRSMEECLTHGTPFDHDADILTFSGRRIRVRVVAEARRGPDGRIEEVIGAFQDISELAAANAEVAEVADRLTTTLESMTDALFIVDPDWRFTYLNGQAGRLLERDRDELLGRNVWEEFPAAVGTEVDEAYHRAMREQTTVVLDRYHYPPLDRWFQINAYPSAQGLTVYFRDVTAQHHAQTELAERGARLAQQAALLDNARDAIMVWDLDASITYWNHRAERLYGYSTDAAVGASVRELLHDDPSAFDVATAATLGNDEWVGEFVQRTHDDRLITVEARWTLVRGEGGRPDAVMAINTDITERKRLEAQFLRAQRMESLGTLAGGIAHDLNNVLAPVMMSIELLRLDETDERRLELLDLIETSTQRGADMIKQVLSFARGVEGEHRELDPASLLHDIGRILRDTLPRNIALDIDTEERLWCVAGEATQLHQVLVNLAVNARDAMPDGGSLQLSAANVTLDEPYAAMTHGARPGPYVRIQVDDDGTGMTSEILDRIFEPFFTTKAHGDGTGLGLSTSLAIVTSHDGFLRVYSEPGQGTTFRLYLPAVSAESTADAEAAATKLPRGDGELVLVVDDETPVREITRQTLQAFGYQVLEASDGAEALSLFIERHEEIDVVLTDMMMPVMDGPATIRALLEIDPEALIVAASGLNANGKLAMAADAGATHFLPKPYTAHTLISTLHELLGQGR